MRALSAACALGVGVATALGTAGCQVGAGALGRRERSVEVRKLDPGGLLVLENTNGSVEVATWSEASVKVEVERRGSVKGLENTRIDISGEGDRVRVKTRNLGSRWFGGSATVQYRVTVPEAADLDVSTTNGRVSVAGVGGAVRASSVNGSVEVEDAVEAVHASTVNGAVRVSFRHAPADGASRLSATNGSVSMFLPPDASGVFEADTVNGGIRTDFPLETTGRFLIRHLSGRIGSGRARFELRTVNGGVRIQKR